MSLFVRDKKFYKWLLMLAVPIILQNLIVTGVGLADNLMVGQLGETIIAGVAQSNQITFIIHMFSIGVSSVIGILSSQYWGEKNTESIKDIVAIGVQVSFAISFLVFLVAFFFPENVLSLLTNEKEVIYEGAKYLRILALSYVFFSLTVVLIASMRCVETVKIGLYVSLAAFIINICLNYILIFGKFGFPKMGAPGAALATVVSRVIEFSIVLGYILWKDKKLKICLKDFLRRNKDLYYDFFRYGFPVILGDVIWGLAMACQSAIIGRLGKDSMTAVSIASTVFSVATVFAYSTSAASAVIVGKTIGERKYELLKKYAVTLQFIFLGTGILAGTLIFLSRGFVIDLYGISDATKATVNAFMLVLAVTSVGTGYQATSLSGIVKAGGDTKFVLFNDLFWMWCVVMPSALLSAFVFKFSPVVVFACLKSDQILKCFVAVVKVNRFRWMKNLTR